MIVVLLEEIQYLYRYAGKAGGVYAEPRKSRVAILVCRRRAISRNLASSFSCISGFLSWEVKANTFLLSSIETNRQEKWNTSFKYMYRGQP